MEQWQCEHIRTHLDELVDVTDLNETERRNKGSIAENVKFYTMIQDKVDGFAQLIKALEDTMQTAAVNILKEAVPTTSSVNSEVSPPSQPGNSEEGGSAQGMEYWQREYIRENIHRLQTITLLGPNVVAKLIASGHLNREDMWKLDAELNEGKKILKFYEIMQTKSGNAYERIVKVFEECAQTAVVHMLLDVRNPRIISN